MRLPVRVVAEPGKLAAEALPPTKPEPPPWHAAHVRVPASILEMPPVKPAPAVWHDMQAWFWFTDSRRSNTTRLPISAVRWAAVRVVLVVSASAASSLVSIPVAIAIASELDFRICG